jgi:hypothetical protein
MNKDVARTDPPIGTSLTQGSEMLCLWSFKIALLPLEKWRRALNQAEKIAVAVGPALYREYCYLENAEAMKKLVEAALVLKKVVLEVGPRTHPGQ